MLLDLSMHPLRSVLALCLLTIILTVLPAWGNPPAVAASDWYWQRINVPEKLTPTAAKPVVVAIVDDGVRTSHRDLQGLLWQNPFEVAGNGIDDDGNGVVDDVHGWDVADKDASATPPTDRLPAFFHGTHLAGIVAGIARTVYGDRAPAAIRLLPVKVLADRAPDTAIRDGYRGIDYAVRAGADIILCAWGIGHISPDEEQILRKAKEKGVLVVASAGNFPEERDEYPAAIPSVLAVAALDRDNRPSARSNYGSFVGLSAPGEEIDSASALADDARERRSGTSQAAAIVAGATAVLLAQHPDASPARLRACLQNTATLPAAPAEYAAKLGAGQPDVRAALACLESGAPLPFHSSQPQGALDLASAGSGTASWTIAPAGEFKGIWFDKPAAAEAAGQATIAFYAGDSAAGTPLASFALAAMPERFFVPGTRATVTFSLRESQATGAELLLSYRAEAIRFRSRYCRDTVRLTEAGSFADGSGDQPYAASSDCKWLITAPPGKVIKFTFTAFDTEPRTDLLYFFDGEGTHAPIMAIFSGDHIPPELTTWRNQVLVWFVTNGEKEGQGWVGDFVFLDETQAQYPQPPAQP